MVRLTSFSLLLMAFVSSTGWTAPTSAHCVDVAHTDGTTENICEKNGKNFLILEFFSPHCGACQRNVGPFKDLEAKASSYAELRLVSLLPIAPTLNFINQFHISTKVALGSNLNASQTYGVTHVPTIVVIDHNNRIIFHESGVLSNHKIQRIVDLIDG